MRTADSVFCGLSRVMKSLFCWEKMTHKMTLIWEGGGRYFRTFTKTKKVDITCFGNE